MIAQKKCNHEGCNNPRWARGFCKFHDPKKPTPINRTFGTRPRKVTGEYALMSKIWSERPHRSFLSHDSISGDMKPSYMAHVLSKGAYPAFRLNPENIVILTEEEHHAFDCYGREEQMRMKGDWEKLYALKEKLKQEYYRS